MYLRNKIFEFLFYFILIFYLKTSFASIIDQTRSSGDSNLTRSNQINSTVLSNLTSINSNDNKTSTNSSISSSSNDKSFSINSSIHQPLSNQEGDHQQTDEALSVQFNQTYKLETSKHNNSKFMNDKNKLIQNLVKEDQPNEDQNKFKNENNLNEILNELKSSNDDQIIKKVDNSLLKIDEFLLKEDVYDQESSLKHLIPKEAEDVYNLRIDESTGCIWVRSEVGVYHFYSTKNQTEVCGLYFVAEQNELIELEFEQFNVSCGDWNEEYPKNNQSLVGVIDGWELNGQFFPGDQDYNSKKKNTKRFNEFCLSNKTKSQNVVGKRFRLSQNCGLIQFRILNDLEGFTVRVRFIQNPRPCNVLLRWPQGIYTFKNYGLAINCSISVMWPQSLQIISTSIGTKSMMIENEDIILDRKPANYYDYQLNKTDDSVDQKLDNNTIQTIADNECSSRSESDYIEIKGGVYLDPGLMMVAEKMCFVKDLKKNKININCVNTAVRLVSSGLYYNSITIAFDLYDRSESNTFNCPKQEANFRRL